MRRILLGISLLTLLFGCTQSALIPEDLQAELDDKVETKIDTGSLYFDSRNITCKSPFGAVEQGTEVSLTFSCRRDDLEKVTLTLSTQNIVQNAVQEKYEEISNLEMVKTLLDEEATNELDTWTVSFTLNDIGVYGYHFTCQKDEDDIVVYADNQTKVDVPYVKIKGTGGIGRITRYGKYKLPYTLTVYTNDFNFPEWSDNMVIYYIFPDRFRNGDESNDPIEGVSLFYDDRTVEFHENWLDQKPYKPGSLSDGNADDDEDYCNDFYGGDLAGITEKLDYLESLGVTVIYLNPIFFAPSNHKYDTADYHTIDPAFGTLSDFEELVDEAEARGIHIILDASLNHCGSDSIYMDRFGKYDSYGAFEDEEIRADSEYYTWFEWREDATLAKDMYGQWANDTLANLEEVESYKDFAYRDDDSVTKYWLSQGIGGWRMDVTPWVTDEFWEEWHDELKADYPDSITFCEVWFDASKYLYGDKFDSVMNYIFRSAALDLGEGKSCLDASESLLMLLENYPWPVTLRTMNLTSTHDLPRTLYEMGWDWGDSEEEYEVAKARTLLTVALQFTYPGAPTIYYGDEVGVTGGDDPFNRGPYPWEDYDPDYGDFSLRDTFTALSELRQDYSSLFVSGQIEFTQREENLMAYERTDEDGGRAIVIFNNSESETSFVPLETQAGTYLDPMSGVLYTLQGGIGSSIPPLSYLILIRQ